jgi:hypothetical protein
MAFTVFLGGELQLYSFGGSSGKLAVACAS